MAGTINPTTTGLYVIGVNNGTATSAPFASIGQPNITFGQAIVVQKAGTTVIGAMSLVTMISGNSFMVRVPLSAIASSNFSLLRYGFNLWPRIGTGGDNGQITDFAPNNALLTAVREPASWAMMIGGFGLIGGMLRKRRLQPQTALSHAATA